MLRITACNTHEAVSLLTACEDVTDIERVTWLAKCCCTSRAPYRFCWLTAELPVTVLVLAEFVVTRPKPLPNFQDDDNPNQINEYVCPPKTYVRSWDGRHDANGLYALAATCSDGTFIGTMGTWGAAGQEFMEFTLSDGYSGMRVRLNAGNAVVAVSVQDRSPDKDQNSQWYGVQTGADMLTACPTGERIVGLTTRAIGGRGNIGSFGLLCGKVAGEC
jgi:hypothetical protein